MTAESTQSDDKTLPLDEDEVRDYLKEHSDFFERHPDMLDHLHIAHSTGSAVSLVEKQVSVLRERNMDMRKRLNSLTENARDNDRLYELTRKLVLELLEAPSLDGVCQAYTRAMAEDFQAEHASIILFGDPAQATEGCRIESAESARIEIGALIKARSAMCGVLRKEELNYLFPGAGEIGSAAVMPLCSSADMGVIAVGSSDAHRYSSNTGTLFLGHIAEVLVRLIPRMQNGDNAQDL